MLKKTVEPYVEGDLKELFRHNPSHVSTDALGWPIGEIDKILAGGNNSTGQFVIPAADTGDGIFFNNRELLSRFAALSIHEQTAFLQSVRAAMDVEEVRKIRLSVRWFKKGVRQIYIGRSDDYPKGSLLMGI